MMLCYVAGSDGELRDGCAVHSSNEVGKVPGRFLHSISHAKGTGRGVRSPTLLLRQGRRQTGPPSSECEFQGSDARGASSCALLWAVDSGPEKPAPQTADTCSSSAKTTMKERNQ